MTVAQAVLLEVYITGRKDLVLTPLVRNTHGCFYALQTMYVSTYTECFTFDITLFKKGLEKPTAYTGQDITRLCETRNTFPYKMLTLTIHTPINFCSFHYNGVEN
jgi:hypothetical protein